MTQGDTMTITVTHLTDIPAYAGEHAIPGIRFRPARQALGVSAWGMSILELDPGCAGYPQHDHVGDGQEEVYVVLDGAAVLVTDGVEREVTRGDLIRVPPATVRKFVTRAQGVTLLALGGTPGQAYPADRRGVTT
ncbi:MAG: cupin domain-containing protein [Kofleriaceae bacterium]